MLIRKIEKDIGDTDITIPEFYFKDQKLEDSEGRDIFMPPKHLTPDGKYIVIEEGFVNTTSGETKYSSPLTRAISLAPVVRDYFFNPDLTKLLLLYDTSDDEKMPSYSMEIVDYVLPELK